MCDCYSNWYMHACLTNFSVTVCMTMTVTDICVCVLLECNLANTKWDYRGGGKTALWKPDPKLPCLQCLHSVLFWRLCHRGQQLCARYQGQSHSAHPLDLLTHLFHIMGFRLCTRQLGQPCGMLCPFSMTSWHVDSSFLIRRIILSCTWLTRCVQWYITVCRCQAFYHQPPPPPTNPALEVHLHILFK